MTLAESFLAWRQERVTVGQVETKPILDHEFPLSDSFADWCNLKQLVQPDDELWTFCSPQQTWDERMGWQGLVLVRDGKLVEVCVTAQN
jgi:hypothetical protein